MKETGPIENSLRELFGVKVSAGMIVFALFVASPLWLIAVESMGWWSRSREVRTAEMVANSKFIEIAIAVLENNPKTPENLPIRQWAASSLQFFSEQISEDGRVRLSDEQVSLLANDAITLTAGGFSKSNATGWALVNGPVEVLEGATDGDGLPTQGSMVRMKDVSLHTEPYDDDEYGETLIGRFDEICSYVRASALADGGVFLLVSPEALSRCRRLERTRRGAN